MAREHLELVPLPNNDAPVVLAAERDQVLLLSGGREGTGKEFFTVEREVLHLGLWQRLSLFLRDHFIDRDLSPDADAFLANGDVASGRRQRDEVDLIGVGRTWNEDLEVIFKVVNDDIVASHVDQLFLFVHHEAVVELTVHTKDELRRDSYRLHAEVCSDHPACLLWISD